MQYKYTYQATGHVWLAAAGLRSLRRPQENSILHKKNAHIGIPRNLREAAYKRQRYIMYVNATITESWV